MTRTTNDNDVRSKFASGSDDHILRVANCSGFYGDKLSAAKEMVEGGPIDVLTGDYLAELTMTILYNQQQSRGGNAGYVGTFLKQLKEVVKPCIERGIKIVSNAGGLNPAGMAEDVRALLDDLGVSAKVAYIDGCLLYTSPSPRDRTRSRMPSSA